MQASRELVQSAQCLLVLRALHLIFKATRYLTEFFLRCSRDSHDLRTGNPYSTFLIEETSQVSVALQYLGLLTSGGDDGSDALRVIWEPAGCSSYLEFVEQHPSFARTVRVASYCASGALHGLFVATREEGVNRLLLLAVSNLLI